MGGACYEQQMMLENLNHQTPTVCCVLNPAHLTPGEQKPRLSQVSLCSLVGFLSQLTVALSEKHITHDTLLFCPLLDNI